jgi:transposase
VQAQDPLSEQRLRASGKIASMGCSVTFLLVRRLLGILRLGPTPNQKDVEIAALRHQLAVLRRQVARPRYSQIDRAVLATLARLLSRERWAAFLVTPATLLRWHWELVARSWTYPQRGRPAPNALDDEVVALLLRLAQENPRWGYLRIVGECRKLGVAISATSVRNVLRRHRLRPAPRTSGPRGQTSFEHRPQALLHATSSTSTRSPCDGSTCCSSSTSSAGRCSWPA